MQMIKGNESTIIHFLLKMNVELFFLQINQQKYIS